MGALLSLPQDVTVPLAGVAAAIFGCFLICYCSWLEYRIVLQERILKRQALQEQADAKVGGQLVFENPAGADRGGDEEHASDLEEQDAGAGVFVRGPVYYSATPQAHVV
jgi:hypothetical protein